MLHGDHGVARVIARPFTGTSPDFYRTKDRRDFSLQPPEPTLLDRAKENGYDVIVIGKVDDIMGRRGYTQSYHSVDDKECIEYVLEAINKTKKALIVANFVQFDMDWGHRNDINGFKNGLIEIDEGIGRIVANMKPDDILFITADHGNDPTTTSTDHSREYVPILAVAPAHRGKNLGTRKSFADVAKTIARYLDIKGVTNGEDFLDVILA
jgi:phosphopentomutase